MSFYKHHVFFCTNEREDGVCCQNHDAQAVRDYAKSRIKALGLSGQGQIRINSSGCLDRCSEGPCLVVYPEGTWYSYANREDVDEIIFEHLQGGRPVPRLMI